MSFDFSRPNKPTPRHEGLPFDVVAKAALGDSLSICMELLPGGVKRGHEYFCAGLQGGKGQSLAVNLNEGVFQDFATGECGADLINLWTAVKGCKPLEAKEALEVRLGLSSPRAAAPRAAPTPIPVQVVKLPAEPEEDLSAEDDPLWWRNGKPAKTWQYLYEDGSVYCLLYRFEAPGRRKIIRPWDPKLKQYAWPEGQRPILYLHDLRTTPGMKWIVAGEKCADKLRDLGLTSTTIAGGESALGKADLSPFYGEDVSIWRDNDTAGETWEGRLIDLLKEVKVTSVRVTSIPAGKPEGWDCADASDAEALAITKATEATKPVHTGRKVVRLSDWTGDAFQGKPADRQWLVKDIFPLGVPGLLVAAGDTGKGMLGLDLALKVATGHKHKGIDLNPVMAFGGEVVGFGAAVVISAEDDKGEIHRRLEKLDPSNKRAGNKNLIVVPLPDAGGVMTLFRTAQGGAVESTEEFYRLRDMLMSINNLKLVILDPLASFIQGDLNADPAVGVYVTSQLAMLAAESGATVIAPYHMKKGDAKSPISTPEQARDAIRGTASIVDGVRCAYCLWQIEPTTAQEMARDMGVNFERGAWVSGAIVKSNGPANRNVHTFVRNHATGLLEDRTQQLGQATIPGFLFGDEMMAAIQKAALAGRPFSNDGGIASAHRRKHELPESMQSMDRAAIDKVIQDLLGLGSVKACIYRGSSPKWLDTHNGPFDKGLGEIIQGGGPDVGE
jgi:hypothetical protein